MVLDFTFFISITSLKKWYKSLQKGRSIARGVTVPERAKMHNRKFTVTASTLCLSVKSARVNSMFTLIVRRSHGGAKVVSRFLADCQPSVGSPPRVTEGLSCEGYRTHRRSARGFSPGVNKRVNNPLSFSWFRSLNALTIKVKEGLSPRQ